MLKLVCVAALLSLSSAQILHSCLVMEIVCGSMMDPGSDLQTSPPPYSIELSTYTAAPNDVITVTLRGLTESFKGIFAQGRRDNTGTDHQAVGVFQEVAGQPDVELCNCSPGKHNAALYIHPFTPLRELVVKYTVPANETKIYIRSSMSLNQNTFWHVNSAPILVQ